MKKLLIYSLVSLISLSLLSQSCLPEGITFTTQAQIDNFQTDFPGCTEIEGDVRIGGDNITNLNGINVLTAIGENLWIEDNNVLTNLTGLNALKTIGGDLGIMDNFLTSLMGLDALTSITGYLFISGNDSLTSLVGLNNIDDSSITDLIITYNGNLSTCDVQSICDYLVSPNGEIEIHDNATGCNSREEVEETCNSSINENNTLYSIKTQPNPFTTSTTIEYELTKPSTVQLIIYDYLGKQIEVIEKKQAQGKQQIIWNAEGLPAGVYFCVIKTNQGSQTTKLIKL